MQVSYQVEEDRKIVCLFDKKDNPLRQVSFTDEPDFAKNSEKPTKGAKREGLKYEAWVANEVEAHYKDCEILKGPWISYANGRRDKLYYAQPDIVIVPKRGTIIVIEVKLTWKEAARSKLRTLYVPLIRKLYPRRKVCAVQVTSGLTPNAAKEAEHKVHYQALRKLGDSEYRLCVLRQKLKYNKEE